MFCRKGLYLKTQMVHHKTVKVIYQTNKTYKELLELSKTISIHLRHWRFLVNEVYKITSYLKPKFMCSFFTHKEIEFNLKKRQVFSLSPARSTYYGTNSGHFRRSPIWNNVPNDIQSSRSVCEFINVKINFRDIDCGRLICRTGIWPCIQMHSFLLLLVLLLFLLLLFFFVIIFSGWFLLGMSYFNVPALNKIINEERNKPCDSLHFLSSIEKLETLTRQK